MEIVSHWFLVHSDDKIFDYLVKMESVPNFYIMRLHQKAIMTEENSQKLKNPKKNYSINLPSNEQKTILDNFSIPF